MDEKHASLYRALIGLANWLIMLSRFDVNYATHAMSQFAMAPCKGHLVAMKRVFGYLKKYHKRCITVDPTWMDWTPYKPDNNHSWKEMYQMSRKKYPLTCPNPLGKLHASLVS